METASRASSLLTERTSSPCKSRSDQDRIYTFVRELILYRFTHYHENVLSSTHRNLCEAILVANPWTTLKAEGGGAILQRFGKMD
jgi:hypothetical protein